MKKTPIEVEASAQWRAVIVRFDEDLRRRGAAEKTRTAYGADLRQFAAWASWQRVEPPAVTPAVTPPSGPVPAPSTLAVVHPRNHLPGPEAVDRPMAGVR